MHIAHIRHEQNWKLSEQKSWMVKLNVIKFSTFYELQHFAFFLDKNKIIHSSILKMEIEQRICCVEWNTIMNEWLEEKAHKIIKIDAFKMFVQWIYECRTELNVIFLMNVHMRYDKIKACQ